MFKTSRSTDESNSKIYLPSLATFVYKVLVFCLFFSLFYFCTINTQISHSQNIYFLIYLIDFEDSIDKWFERS